MEPVVLEAGPEVGHAVRQWGHVRMFSPWEYNIDKAAERLLRGGGLERAGRLTSIRPAASWSSAISSRWRRARRSRTASAPASRVTAVGRAGFDKVKTNGRAAAPFAIRYQNGKGPEQLQGRCRDRCHRHLVLAQSGRRRRPAGDRRGARPAADRLRHARRAGPRSRALCRQDRRRAGRRPFGDRHADRSGAAEGRGAGDRDRSGCCAATSRKRRSAAAPTTSSRRAARSARPSPRWSSAARSASRPASASRTSAATAHGCASAPARPCCGRHRRRRRAGGRHRLPPAARFPARDPARARSGGRKPAGAGAADRSQHP